jgi:hypothetical protein
LKAYLLQAARAACVALGILIGFASCAARRELAVISDPPGALVRIDEKIVGTTPYEERFQAYGTRRITLYRDGYRTSSRLVKLKPPWHGRFPLDIVSEVLVPVGWRDRHVVTVTLEPESGRVTEPDLQAVLKRAASLRLAGPEGPRPPEPRPLPPE